MKSVLKFNEKETSENIYPYLGIFAEDRDFVVLFTRENTGIVVQSNKSANYPIGDYSTAWNEKTFVPFEGIVELSN